MDCMRHGNVPNGILFGTAFTVGLYELLFMGTAHALFFCDVHNMKAAIQRFHINLVQTIHDCCLLR